MNVARGDGVSGRVAGVLKYFEYSALGILSLAVVLRLIHQSFSMMLNIAGTILVALAPAAGALAAGIASFKKGDRPIFIYSIIILAVYIASFLLARGI